jgi:adhesin transport system membrane fusion protein
MMKNDQDKDLPKIDPSELEFIDDSRKAMLTESPIWSNVLLYSMAAFVIIFLIWSKFAILDEITVATGKVVPSAQVQIIQSLDGGIVQKIFVKEGDIVQRGQVLIRLDNTQAKSTYDQGLAKYWALLASTARLQAEQNGDPKINFPESLLKTHPELAASEQNLFDQHMQEVNENLATAQKSFDLAQKQLAITKPLVAEGLMSEMDLLKQQQSVNDLQGKISQIREAFQSKAHDQYNDQAAQLSALMAALSGLKDRLTRTTIRSPVAGIVKNINIATVGGVIQPGMDIMEIVPLEDTLLIEALVRPADIAFIHPDQKAMVKFTAYDFSIYGGLEGTVEYISADTVKNEDNQQDQQRYYKILVRTKDNHLGTAEKPLPIIPGMMVMVDIQTGKKSVLDYLLNPITKARDSALRER